MEVFLWVVGGLLTFLVVTPLTINIRNKRRAIRKLVAMMRLDLDKLEELKTELLAQKTPKNRKYPLYNDPSYLWGVVQTYINKMPAWDAEVINRLTRYSSMQKELTTRIFRKLGWWDDYDKL